MNRKYQVLSCFYLPDGTIIKVIQDKDLKKFYRVEDTGKELKIMKIEEKDLQDCMAAIEAFKNDVYNLSCFPQVNDLFRE